MFIGTFVVWSAHSFIAPLYPTSSLHVHPTENQALCADEWNNPNFLYLLKCFLCNFIESKIWFTTSVFSHSSSNNVDLPGDGWLSTKRSHWDELSLCRQDCLSHDFMENYYFITAVSIKQHEKNKQTQRRNCNLWKRIRATGGKRRGVSFFARILSASFKCFYFSNNSGFFLQTLTIKVNKICGKCWFQHSHIQWSP